MAKSGAPRLGFEEKKAGQLKANRFAAPPLSGGDDFGRDIGAIVVAARRENTLGQNGLFGGR